MLSAVQEMKLIARCVAFDDRDAFGQLVEAHQPSLRRFLYNLTGRDAVLTDDLAQETFIKAWLAIRSFKGVAAFRTWLFKIAYNEFLSERRKYSATAVELDDTLAVESSPAAAVDAHIDINTAMGYLSDKERSAVLLFYIEELPIKKISKITGMPEGTVKVYLSRAREKMKKVIETSHSL